MYLLSHVPREHCLQPAALTARESDRQQTNDKTIDVSRTATIPWQSAPTIKFRLWRLIQVERPARPSTAMALHARLHRFGAYSTLEAEA